MPAWTFSPALMPPQGDRLGHLEFLYPERHGLAHHWRTNISMALFQIAPSGRMAEDNRPEIQGMSRYSGIKNLLQNQYLPDIAS